jgi:hypothetical protein
MQITLIPRPCRSSREHPKAEEHYVFPEEKPGKPLSGMAMLKLLERMGRNDPTVRGFRSTFRDWGAEQTAYPAEILKMVLASRCRMLASLRRLRF